MRRKFKALEPGKYTAIVQDVKITRRRTGPYMTVSFEISELGPNIYGTSFGMRMKSK